MSSGLAGSRNDCHTTGCHVREELPALHFTVLVTPAVVAFALDPGERRELPGHERIAAVLDRRPDLDADFRAGLDDVLGLVALLAARAWPA